MIQQLDFQRRACGKWKSFREDFDNRTLAVLADYRWANRLLNCMVIPWQAGSKIKKPCLRYEICHYCAWKRSESRLRKYGLAYEDGKWVHLTLTVNRPVNLSMGREGDISMVWDFFHELARRLSKAKMVDGILGHLEIAALSLYPDALVAPHVHLLVLGARPDLMATVNAFMTDLCQEINMAPYAPQVHHEPVESEAHFLSCTKYTKSLDVAPVYELGYLQASAEHNIPLLNQNVGDLYGGYALAQIIDRKHALKDPNGQPLKNADGSPAYQFRSSTRPATFAFGQAHGCSRTCISVPADVRDTPQHADDMRERALRAYAEEEKADQE